MPDAKRKSRKMPFYYGGLPADIVTEAQGAARRIATRTKDEERAKNFWLLHALDIHEVHAVSKRSKLVFKEWVASETPFSLRKAEMMSAVAAMLLPLVEPAKFARLPAMNRTVVYRLAALAEDHPARDAFLLQIISGDRVTLKELDAFLNPPQPKPEPDPAPDRPDDRVEAVKRFLRTLDAAERDLLDRLRRGLPGGLTLDFLVGLTGEPEAYQPEPAKPDPVADQPEPAAEPDPEPTEDPGVDPDPRPEPEPDPKPHPDPDSAPRGDASGGSWNREAAIRRIRALMAKTVSNGCTEAEALNAADMVRHLLDKYALSLSDLEIQSQTCEQRTATNKLHDVWRVSHAISVFTGTRVWMEGGGIVYFGFAHDVEVAQFLTDICKRAMDRAFRNYLRDNRWMGVDGRSARKTFMTTMAERLSIRINDMAVQRSATAKTGSSSSLVVVRDAVVERQFAALGLRLKKMKRSSYLNFDPLAHEAALTAADQVSLATGIDQDNCEQVAAA